MASDDLPSAARLLPAEPVAPRASGEPDGAALRGYHILPILSVKRTRKLLPWGVATVLGGLNLAACSDVPSAVEPVVTPRPSASGVPLSAPMRAAYGHSRSLDARLARADSAAPGVAGFYRDGSGVLHLRLVNPRNAHAARGALRAAFASLGAGDSPLPVPSDLDGAVIESADYSFSQLAKWKADYYAAGDLRGVALVDVDERRNRLVVGAEDAVAAGHIRAALARAGVPSAAVVVETTGRFRPMQSTSIQGLVRPTAGGAQITTSFNGTSYNTCSLGFNLQITGFSRPHYLTASHCFAKRPDGFAEMGQVPGTWAAGQPYSYIAQYVIGPEVEDFPFLPMAGCPSGATCRWADAALGLYPAGTTSTTARVGLIARPNQQNPTWGQPGWDQLTTTPFQIVAESYSFQGEPAHHVGRSTGWQSGTVTRTCFDVPDYSNSAGARFLLCQVEADGLVNGGDSGGPAFRFYNGVDASQGVSLLGVVSIGQCNEGDSPSVCRWIYSPIGSIHHESGSFEVRY